jgi:hypothetical protein
VIQEAWIGGVSTRGFAIEFWPRRADGFWPTCRPST